MLLYGVLMLWTHAVLSVPALPAVASPPPPPPPQNISVEKWLMRWTPATEDGDITYSVQYRSFDREWRNVSSCVRTSSTSCNVTSSATESEHGCVMLRVRAERHGLKSKAAQACSRQGDSCTPEVRLTARPGSLTVYVSRNHSLVQEYGDHLRNRVYYRKEENSQERERWRDGVDSVPLYDLEEGESYCVKVQYMLYAKEIGLKSCTQCEVIPRSDNSVQTEVIAVVAVVLVLAVIAVTAYILICHRGKIKRWLRPPYEMPEVLQEFHPKHHIISCPSSPSEEHCDVLSFPQ